MHELPRHWRLVRLSGAGKWHSGGTPFTEDSRYWDGEIPWISAASLKVFRITDSERRITDLGARAGTQVVPPGTVIFVVRGMSLKSEFRIGVAQRQLAFGQDCKAIVPAAGIDGTFLALAIKARTTDVLSMVDEAGHGTGRLPIDLISRLEVGIPPKTEQRRISRILDTVDEQIAVLDRLIAKRSTNYSGLVAHLLSDIEANASPLINFLSVMPRNGYSPKEVDTWTGMCSLGLGCLTLHGFEPLQIKPIPQHDPRNDSALLANGDLLVSRANTREMVGLVGRYRDIGTPCIYPDLMMRLRPRASCRAAFLEAVLRSPYVRRQIECIAQGTSGSMVKISGSSVAQLTVVIPDISEQDRVLRVLAATDSQIRADQAMRTKWRLLRQGLMDDLLTGRVQVPSGDYRSD